MASGPNPHGFDAAAERYDADELGNEVLAHMRARVFRYFRLAFSRHSKLIELGSGTGTEAARLVSERDCEVALVDVSPRLLDHAARKVRATKAGNLLGTHLLEARSVGKLEETYGPRSFDGAYSSFGPLNCEPDLNPIAHGLASLVRPGGTVVLSVINRWCPVEVAWFAAHGQWREASRRWGGPVHAAAYPGGPKDVHTWYYSRRDIARAFALRFFPRRGGGSTSSSLAAAVSPFSRDPLRVRVPIPRAAGEQGRTVAHPPRPRRPCSRPFAATRLSAMVGWRRTDAGTCSDCPRLAYLDEGRRARRRGALSRIPSG